MNCFDISVVIPMYNGSRTIARALQSIEKQTVQVKDVIVIDDGSTDSSCDVVNEYIKKTSLNVHLIRQKNQGVSAARNAGIHYSDSLFIAFLDSDDEWVPNKIELQMPLFSDPNIVMVGGYHYPCNPNTPFSVSFPNVHSQMLKNKFQTSTIIARRDAANAAGGFFDKQKYAEEGRFYFDLMRFGKLALINRQVVIYDGGLKRGFGSSGLSKNLTSMQFGEMSNIKHAKMFHNVSIYFYVFAIAFSLTKFFRRVAVVAVERILMFKVARD